jgi:hypothetical protein
MQKTSRRIAVALFVLAGVIVMYWVLWATQRSVIASDHGAVYTNFENAFPLADGLLALGMALTAWALWTQRRVAVLFGLLSAGGGLYLFAMDVLYDAEHGIWSRGAGGAIEATINVVTLAASVFLGGWIWNNRRGLDPDRVG